MGLLHLFGIREESIEGDVGASIFILLAILTFLLSRKINRHLENKSAVEKAEADREKAETDRKEREERERQRELENKYYRENPERLVTDYCPECNMQIPAFARICPYCRTNLRAER